MELSDVHDALYDEAIDGVSSVAYGPDADAAGALYESLVDAFQGFAISHLLQSYDAETFRRYLIYAAGARRQFLQVCLRDAAAPRERALSRTDALFCAIAARDAVLASELVRLGPTDWVPEGEYEDDFCYHAVVSHLAAPETAAGLPPVGALLDRFAAVIDGLPPPRLAVCRALVGDDAPAFRVAFDDLLLEREAWAEELYPARRDQPLFLVARHVFVEGLALLALADARGWPMPDVYAFCPEPARLAPVSAPPLDLFVDVVPFLRESRRQRGLPA